MGLMQTIIHVKHMTNVKETVTRIKDSPPERKRETHATSDPCERNPKLRSYYFSLILSIRVTTVNYITYH